MKHTPGPWKFRQPLHDKMRGLPVRTLEVLAEQNGIYKPYVADVRSLDAEGNDNTEANARLIAAAPDMLDALEAILGEALLDADDGELALIACEAIRSNARAAIAKAKGEE